MNAITRKARRIEGLGMLRAFATAFLWAFIGASSRKYPSIVTIASPSIGGALLAWVAMSIYFDRKSSRLIREIEAATTEES